MATAASMVDLSVVRIDGAGFVMTNDGSITVVPNVEVITTRPHFASADISPTLKRRLLA